MPLVLAPSNLFTTCSVRKLKTALFCVLGGMARKNTAQRRRDKARRQKERLKERQEEKPLIFEEETEFDLVQEPIDLPEEFRAVAKRFGAVGEEEDFSEEDEVLETKDEREVLEQAKDELAQEEPKTLSKRQMKRLLRVSLAELKQKCKRPDLVEWEDVTAKDPELLIYLKGYRGTVSVPRHWSRKRKYLAGKRGFVKPPFELPPFIKDTGITEARDQQRRIDDKKSLKVKGRERMRPKIGKLSIDYQKLYDAFFKYQTKPPLSQQGDLYYEGKEFEVRYRDKKPGKLSDEAKQALGMGPLAPPPWLHAMQRFGLPPSYQHLKIPGMNAPIPEGAQWGYHAGGWGRPPLDEVAKPAFEGAEFDERDPKIRDVFLKPIKSHIWGEFEPEEEEIEAS